MFYVTVVYRYWYKKFDPDLQPLKIWIRPQHPDPQPWPGAHGIYMRWLLRTRCACVKENRPFLKIGQNFRLLLIETNALTRSYYPFHYKHAHLYSCHTISEIYLDRPAESCLKRGLTAFPAGWTKPFVNVLLTLKHGCSSLARTDTLHSLVLPVMIANPILGKYLTQP